MRAERHCGDPLNYALVVVGYFDLDRPEAYTVIVSGAQRSWNKPTLPYGEPLH